MSADKADSWVWIEDNADEPPAIAQARMDALELGAQPISPATGAALRMLVRACRMKAVAEVGTGAGVSALWLLSGMDSDGVLTTIDSEAEVHRAARLSIERAGVVASRVRLINGRALNVLPRMAQAAYDMVFIDADIESLSGYVQQAEHMLRPGGIIAIAHAMWGDTVSDPARRESDTVAMREVVRSMIESEHYVTNVLAVGDGLLVAIKS